MAPPLKSGKKQAVRTHHSIYVDRTHNRLVTKKRCGARALQMLELFAEVFMEDMFVEMDQAHIDLGFKANEKFYHSSVVPSLMKSANLSSMFERCILPKGVAPSSVSSCVISLMNHGK